MNNRQNQIEQREFFTYAARVSNLDASESGSVNVTIDSDASFTLIKMCFFADIAGGAQTEDTAVIPLVRVSIVDTGSGRFLQSAGIPIYSYAGRGKLPFILPIPKIFAANSTVRFTFENYSAATDYANVEIALQGYKSYWVNPNV
jgi:hypothetical protein